MVYVLCIGKFSVVFGHCHNTSSLLLSFHTSDATSLSSDFLVSSASQQSNESNDRLKNKDTSCPPSVTNTYIHTQTDRTDYNTLRRKLARSEIIWQSTTTHSHWCWLLKSRGV